MGSFRAAAQKKVPVNEPISTRALIQQLGWTPPVSLLALIRDLDVASRSFHQDIVTPEGTPLGGWVDLQVQSNGNYNITFHMHSSSIFGNFDFDLRAYLNVPNGPTFFFHHSGHVSGVDDADYPESGTNPLIAMYWSEIQSSGSFTVAKDYQWGGVVGTLDGLVKDILDLGAAVVGTAVGAVIAVTQEAIGWIHANLGPGGTIGVLSGVAVFVVAAALGVAAGAALILGIVAGVAAGAVSSALIDSRPIAQAEIDLASTVFGNTLPYDKVMLTNLGGLGGRAFTAPGVDGNIYCNLGSVYANPLGSYPSAYPAAGQVLIHELTHAWQIAHTGSLPGFVCSAVVTQANFSFGDNVYQYGPAGPPWWSLNPEQQGAIVDQWFGGNQNSAGFKAMDQTNPYYRYIRDNILHG
jgi:hypothetical protein